MTHQNDDGWTKSADAWITTLGDIGDQSRAYVLDQPMMARVRASGAKHLVDVGCGEGRFCRMARNAGLQTLGIDPTSALLEQARALDPVGTYLSAFGENLPLPDASTDLVVFYLSLIDIPDFPAAIAEAKRVLRPGGHILMGNLSGFFTAARQTGWTVTKTNTADIHLRGYLENDVYWAEWNGIRVHNWHRPLTAYFQAFLNEGLILTHFDEPPSTHPDAAIRDQYNNTAYLMLSEWQKPA